MRRFIRYLRLFQKKQKWALFLLFLLYFTALLFFVIGAGQANYTRRSLRYFEKSGIKKADYVLRSFRAVEDKTLLTALRRQTGIDTVLLEWTAIPLDIRPAGPMAEKLSRCAIRFIPAEGAPFFAPETNPALDGLTPSSDPAVLDVIAGAESSFLPGDTLPVKINETPVTFRVAAIQPKRTLAWTFDSGGTSVSWDDLTDDVPALFVLDRGQLRHMAPTLRGSMGMMIVYKEHVTQEERAAVRSQVEGGGAVSVYAEEAITKATESSIAARLRKQLPLPAVLALTALVLCVSITIMRLYRMERYIAVYRLSGMSRRSTLLGLNSWVTLASLGLTYAVVSVFERLRPDFLYRGNHLLIEWKLYGCAAVFILFSMLLSFVLSAILLRQTTLVEKLRRRT